MRTWCLAAGQWSGPIPRRRRRAPRSPMPPADLVAPDDVAFATGVFVLRKAIAERLKTDDAGSPAAT